VKKCFTRNVSPEANHDVILLDDVTVFCKALSVSCCIVKRAILLIPRHKPDYVVVYLIYLMYRKAVLRYVRLYVCLSVSFANYGRVLPSPHSDIDTLGRVAMSDRYSASGLGASQDFARHYVNPISNSNPKTNPNPSTLLTLTLTLTATLTVELRVLSVSRSVCPLVTSVYFAKTAD